jgi:hypothetical protein
MGVFSEMSRPGALGTKEKMPMPRLSSLVAAKGLLWDRAEDF